MTAHAGNGHPVTPPSPFGSWKRLQMTPDPDLKKQARIENENEYMTNHEQSNP